MSPTLNSNRYYLPRPLDKYWSNIINPFIEMMYVNYEDIYDYMFAPALHQSTAVFVHILPKMQSYVISKSLREWKEDNV